MKKGSFMLAILLIAEFIFVFKLNTAFPASIIGWSGKIEWEMLIYWIVHVVGLYMIGQVFFLKHTINRKDLLVVLLIFIVVRILFDFWMYKFLDDKTFKFFFEFSKISLFLELGIQIFLIVLLCLVAYLKKYRFVLELKNVLMMGMILVICIICVRGNLRMTNDLITLDNMYGKKTISTLNIVTAFAGNLLFEKLITFLTFLAVFLNLKKLKM